jgi:hypothetical protein
MCRLNVARDNDVCVATRICVQAVQIQNRAWQNSPWFHCLAIGRRSDTTSRGGGSWWETLRILTEGVAVGGSRIVPRRCYDSNLHQYTGCSEWGLLWFSSLPSCKCQNSTAIRLWPLYNSLFTIQPTIRYCFRHWRRRSIDARIFTPTLGDDWADSFPTTSLPS